MHPRLETTEGMQELCQEGISPPRGARQLSTVGWQRTPHHPRTLPCHSQVSALTILGLILSRCATMAGAFQPPKTIPIFSLQSPFIRDIFSVSLASLVSSFAYKS